MRGSRELCDALGYERALPKLDAAIVAVLRKGPAQLFYLANEVPKRLRTRGASRALYFTRDGRRCPAAKAIAKRLQVLRKRGVVYFGSCGSLRYTGEGSVR